MNITKYDEVFEKFYVKIQNDKDYFSYGLTQDEVIELAKFHSLHLLDEALSIIETETCQEIDWFDKDDKLEQFNFKLKKNEINLICNLMGEALLEEDTFKLKAKENVIGYKDLKVFSPAEERRTFNAMVKSKIDKNREDLKSYDSINRKTGKPKQINYGGFYD